MRGSSSCLFLVAAACGGSAKQMPAVCSKSFDLIVVGSDYSSTQVGGVSLNGESDLRSTVDLGADPALSFSRRRAFLLARDTGTIFELDPHCGGGIARLSSLDPMEVGTSNPQDVSVAADGSLYITRFQVPTLLVVSAAGDRATIDLSALDAYDGNPDMSGVQIAGERAFVALETLDGPPKSKYESHRPSQMAVIDTTSRRLVTTIQLVGRNPFGSIAVADDGALWLAEPGSWDVTTEKDAGLERFDPQTLATELVISETTLGGSAAETAVLGSCAVAIVADGSARNKTSLRTIDLTTKNVLTSLVTTDDFELRGLVLTDAVLIVGDRHKTDLGYVLHVFRPRGGCVFMRDHDVTISAPPIGIRSARPFT